MTFKTYDGDALLKSQSDDTEPAIARILFDTRTCARI